MYVVREELSPLAGLLLGRERGGEEEGDCMAGPHGLTVEHSVVHRVPLGGCGFQHQLHSIYKSQRWSV